MPAAAERCHHSRRVSDERKGSLPTLFMTKSDLCNSERPTSRGSKLAEACVQRRVHGAHGHFKLLPATVWQTFEERSTHKRTDVDHTAFHEIQSAVSSRKGVNLDSSREFAQESLTLRCSMLLKPDIRMRLRQKWTSKSTVERTATSVCENDKVSAKHLSSNTHPAATLRNVVVLPDFTDLCALQSHDATIGCKTKKSLVKRSSTESESFTLEGQLDALPGRTTETGAINPRGTEFENTIQTTDSFEIRSRFRRKKLTAKLVTRKTIALQQCNVQALLRE